MLDLEVSPEEGLQHDLWEFVLGMHFSQAVAIVQSQVRVIKYAHVIYNDQNPLAHDLILDLPSDGLRLIFDSKAQRLKLIEIYALKLLRLKYCGTVFNGSEVIPSVHQIDHAFGPTRPGTFDKERNLFALNFRGLTFYFPIDPSSSSATSSSHSSSSHGLSSLRFPGEATPILARLVIYQDPTSSGGCPSPDSPCPPLPSSCFRGNVFTSAVSVLRDSTRTRSLGLRLSLYARGSEDVDPSEEPTYFSRSLHFGDSAQSVGAKLGAPTRIYFKSDDKMKIHSKEAHKKVAADKSDYFFNYFTLGIDILFDATSNTVIKFLLHTNFPGHYDFTDYHRCPFTLTLGRSSTPLSSSNTSQGQGLQGTGHQGQTLLQGQPAHKFGFENQNLNPNPASAVADLLLDKVSLAPAPPTPAAPTSGGGGGGGKKKKKNGGNGGNNKQANNKTQPSNPVPSSNSNSSSEKSSPPSEESPCSLNKMLSGGNSSAAILDPSATSLDIGWDSRWEEIRNFLWAEKAERGKLEKPVVLTRSSASNPFGPSLCYGVQDLIFEVMSNDHLATVTIYGSAPPTTNSGHVEDPNKALLDLGA